MYGGREGDGRDRTEEFKECFLHYMSLLHAVAIQHLRGDWDLSNLHAMQPTDKPPPVVKNLSSFTYFVLATLSHTLIGIFKACRLLTLSCFFQGL